MPQMLAEQEELHEKTFRGMLETIAEDRPPEEYAGQKSAYVQVLLDSRVLPNAEAGQAALAKMTEDVEAIDFALGFEKDTILFMQEMREMVPATHGATVDELIAEEKRHVQQLTAAKSQLA